MSLFFNAMDTPKKVRFLLIVLTEKDVVKAATKLTKALIAQVHGGAEVAILTTPEFKRYFTEIKGVEKIYLNTVRRAELVAEFKYEHFDHVVDCENTLATYRLRSKLQAWQIVMARNTFTDKFKILTRKTVTKNWEDVFFKKVEVFDVVNNEPV